MTPYIVRRLLQGLLVVWAAFTVAFVVLYLLPSDPAEIIAGAGSQAGGGEIDPAELDRLRTELGLDRPRIVQYLSMLGGFVVGDWGRSFQSGQPVALLLWDALPKTASIAVPALLLGALLGCVFAFGRALTRSKGLAAVLGAVPATAASLPTFWTALVLIQLFSFNLRWLPPYGTDGVGAAILPVATLAILVSAFCGQLLSRSIRRAMDDQYALVATAKGISRLRLISVHVLRNASLPSLTMLGMLVGNLLAGAVIVETVFGRQGLGRLMADAVNGRDIPLVLGLVLLSAIVFVVVTLAVDLLYPLIDPRLRTGLSGRRRRRIVLRPQEIE